TSCLVLAFSYYHFVGRLMLVGFDFCLYQPWRVPSGNASILEGPRIIGPSLSLLDDFVALRNIFSKSYIISFSWWLF
ncbi:17913_t:CDS:2, partial [Gigaspora rosea]